jgi:ParB family transcriptional regulator, chromosome partitioning protein
MAPGKAKRRGLGRGLDALLQPEPAPAASSASSSEEAGSPRVLPLEALKPNRFQPRSLFDENGLQELAASIKEQGIVQPIVVSPRGDGTFTIIAGERRWRASQRAGLVEVPVVVRDVQSDQELLELALVENIQRTDLNPMEEAEAYRVLGEGFELSQQAVAQRVGKARSTVTNSLRLLRLAPEVQDLLREGALTPGQARPMLALPTEEEQVALAQRAVAEGLTARDIERLTATKPAPPPPKPEPPKDVHAAVAAEKLTRRLQTRVEIHRKGKGGAVKIFFHSEEELMRIYEALASDQEDEREDV